MSHRIRYAFADKPSTPLSGTIEADETYIGGHRDRLPGVGTLEWKVPVVTLVERDGRAHSTVMPTVNAKNLKGFLTGNADPSSHLMTDQHTGYVPAGKTFASHESVDHKHEEWVRGNVHTNTVEGFFSQLKRSLDGTHHHVSPKHLQRYVSEFDFRYSTRKSSDGERTVAAVKKARGKRLKYEQVTKRPNA
jgi:hypothetical protein